MTLRVLDRARSARPAVALLGLALVVTALARPAAADADGAGVPTSGAAAGERTVSTTYDFDDAHAFTGLGSNVWATSENAAARDRVLGELNMRSVRLGSGRPVVPPDRLAAAGDSVDGILGLFRELVLPATRTNSERLAAVLNERGITHHLVVWAMPAPWAIVETTGCPDNATKCVYANSDRIGEFANYVTAEVLFALELGLPVELIEIGNEPDGYWNTLFTPEQYAETVRVARATLDAHGLEHIGIQGPGTGTQRNALPYLEALVDSGAIDELAAISVHSYDTSYTDRCDERECLETPVGLSEEFQTAWNRLGLDMTLNITEYTNRDRATWNSPPYDCEDGSAGAGRRNGVCGLNTPEYALWLATEGLKLVADGANSIIQWELTDQSWNPVNWGIVRRDGSVRPSYHAFSTFQTQMGHATSVVRGSTSDRDTVTAAFRVGAKVVVVISNLTDDEVMIRPLIRGLTRPPIRVEKQQIYSGVTGESTEADVIRGGQASPRVVVPARSIVAITLS